MHILPQAEGSGTQKRWIGNNITERMKITHIALRVKPKVHIPTLGILTLQMLAHSVYGSNCRLKSGFMSDE